MTTVPVQDERHLPSSVLLMDQPEELLEVFFPLLLPLQEQPCPVGGVEGAEDHPLRVGPAQGDLGVFPAPRPAGPQRREQQQVGLVLEQDDVSRPQPLDVLADPSHLRGPARVRVQDVARPFPDVTQGMQLAAQRGIAESGQTPVSQMGSGATGWSTPWPGSRSDPAVGPRRPAGWLGRPRPIPRAGLCCDG